MRSQNFEFLRARRPALADLAVFAEKYAHEDPASSLVKQRVMVEHFVLAIYEAYRLRLPYSDSLSDYMGDEAFRQSVPVVVQTKLHIARKAGNIGAHTRAPVTPEQALAPLAELFEAARWFHLQIDRGSRAETGTYVPPGPPGPTPPSRETLEQLRLAEAKIEAVLHELDAANKARAAAEQAAAQSEGELARRQEEGQRVASVLEMNEEETRFRLIDQALQAAGWKVGPRKVSTEEVGQEVALTTMRTDSKLGFADYVLYGDDGKPLAVVEAKKTAKDAKIGAEQARQYADALERETGVRPVIFFTNGMETFAWDDVQGYPWRKVYGFYSKDSLAYLHHQRAHKKPLETVAPDGTIAGRLYQLEAIKRVGERFASKFRRSLIVQATGTGKTRVAIALCDVLLRAGWAKRILFLCDRRELRKQADRAFKEFLPNEPRVVVSSETAHDREKRIYLATYPAMMKAYESFDVGFFDLVIADESHRSVYNKFRTLFRYFDALQVGLTATPVRFIDRNTYDLFGCDDRLPTSSYGFEEAVSAKPPHLVPFRVRVCTTEFRKKGLRYAQLDEARRRELEDQDPNAEQVDVDPGELDRLFFNRDTTRHVWRTLMDEGIRERTQSRVGKTIVFARNHRHAVHLVEVFTEMYPQYGSGFCRVIDNQEPKADQLIDDFKTPAHELTIAVSVDMLDTGIDVPEVVNLVFAKPVQSYVKFWQMIGRGTRLCPHLFGYGHHKTEFVVFDHASNFWFFEERYQEKTPVPPKSLLERLFEVRVELAQANLDRFEQKAFEASLDLLTADLHATRETKALDVVDRWRELEALMDRERLLRWAPATKNDLLVVAAPLQRHRSIRGDEAPYRFDLLMAELEVERLRGGAQAPDALNLRDRVRAQVDELPTNQNPVKARAEAIKRVRSQEFWNGATFGDLEVLRDELRGIMRYRSTDDDGPVGGPREVDVKDGEHSSVHHVPKLEGLELVEYGRRVKAVLEDRIADNPTLQRVREGKAVREEELEDLARLVLEVDDKANVKRLAGHDPATRRSLLAVFRSLVGLDERAVSEAFEGFVHAHPNLSARQLTFLRLLQNHIVQNGGIEIERLYEPPFTNLHAESVDGLFPATADVSAILAILSVFASNAPPESRRPA